MKKSELVIGVLGGMGTYATIDFFYQYASIFDAEKEWDRPRIIIDNRCTMPSRVRAFLYGEKQDVLLSEMCDSLNNLINAGSNRIILLCNTSHLFLPKIYERIPKLKDRIINIIDNCVETINNDGLKCVHLLASEGTIESSVYQNKLESKGIKCSYPKIEEYELIRTCIEAVKQNKYTNEVRDIFVSLMNEHETCILGCTELPILYRKYSEFIHCKNVYDPLILCLNQLREEYNNE